MPRTWPTHWPTVRMTLGRSLGPMKISARIATTASSVESTPNTACSELAGFVVSRRRRWRGRLGGTWSYVDRLLRSCLIARQLAGRFVAALLVIIAPLVLVLVGHS